VCVCVRESVCVDSPTLWPCVFWLGVHEYTWVETALEGSAVQSCNHVSVFELPPPLFDIGSDGARGLQLRATTLATSPPPPHMCGAGPQGVFVRPSGHWHAILISQLLLEFSDYWGQIPFLRWCWQRSSFNMNTTFLLFNFLCSILSRVGRVS